MAEASDRSLYAFYSREDSILPRTSPPEPSLLPTVTQSAEIFHHFVKDPVKSDFEQPFKNLWTPHPRFYLEDGNVIFLLGNTLFKLHRYFFTRDSPIFSAMFSLPPPDGAAPEGKTPDTPIQLTGIEASEFANFLCVLYPTDFALCELKQPEEWVAVLKVASQWDFASVRRLAVDKLAALLPSAEKIAIGKRYDVHDWLAPAYTELCMRERPLCLSEGECLGMADVVEIYRLRNLVRYHAHLNRHADTITALVEREFRLN